MLLKSELTAVPESKLAKLFVDGATPEKRDGLVYIDRDPEIFKWVLTFL